MKLTKFSFAFHEVIDTVDKLQCVIFWRLCQSWSQFLAQNSFRRQLKRGLVLTPHFLVKGHCSKFTRPEKQSNFLTTLWTVDKVSKYFNVEAINQGEGFKGNQGVPANISKSYLQQKRLLLSHPSLSLFLPIPPVKGQCRPQRNIWGSVERY